MIFSPAFLVVPATALLLISSPLNAAPEHVPLIVDWGHDWGNGWYRQTPEQAANSAWRKLAEIDLNENGTTEDDYIGGWEYSWDTPLNPTNILYDTTYPSAPFYGAAVVKITDIPEKDGGGYEKVTGPTEGHINQNHELRDDWNLMSFPTRKREPGLSRYAGGLLMFWKKEDFLNGGAEFPVRFGADGTIGVFISRYWGGINWGRWVVRDSGQFYISEDTFAGEDGQFDLENSGEFDGAKNPVVRTTHVIRPSATKWALYNPAAPFDVFFEAQGADFQPRDFTNVEAVGFLAQRDLSKGFPVAGGLWDLPHGVGEPIALKVNAFQARAEIEKPADQSSVVEMVPLGPADKPALFAAKTETTYDQWLEVFRWAVTNQRAGNMTEGFENLDLGGFTFLRDGAMGSMRTGRHDSHSPLEPVTDISWPDAIVWCNALSLLEGRTPAYYEDAEFTAPYQHVLGRSKRENRDLRKPVYWKKEADGYRLPTLAEFAFMTGGDDKPVAENAWIVENSDARTQPVGGKSENPAGLLDILGNVAEYVWESGTDMIDPAARPSLKVAGGSFTFPEDENTKSLMPFGGSPRDGSYDVGFRVVRNGGGELPQTAADALPVREVPLDTVNPPASPMTEDALRAEVLKILNPKVIAGAGGLPDNDNMKKNYAESGEYDLEVSSVEVPHRVWNLVRQWAEQSKGYRFNHDGDMGSSHFRTAETKQAERQQMEPVTNITWFDAIVWNNALSELLGKKPVYVDVESGEPLRDAATHRLPMYQEYAYPNQGRYAQRPLDTGAVVNFRVVASNDGFRLPTIGECEAFQEKHKNEDQAWFVTNSGLRTHPVATRQEDANGLFDVEGNVLEMTYGGSGLFGQVRFGTSFGDSPGVYPHNIARMEDPFVGRPNVGFRPVARTTGN